MNTTLNISEPGQPERPPDPSRAIAMTRKVALGLLLFLGVAFAFWAIKQALSRRETAAPPPTRAAVSPTAVPALAANRLMVHVQVRMRGSDGLEVPIGTTLPRQVALKLLGQGEQPYEARFDRVGVWAMEVPPGEYQVPADQSDLGEWRWTLSGPTVSETPEGYTVTFDKARALATLNLLLY